MTYSHDMTPAESHEWSRSSLADDHENLRGLRATIELAPIGIAHFDLDGRLLLTNARLCSILGYTREELLTRTFQELTHPEDTAECLRRNTQLAAGVTSSYEMDARLVRGDGRLIWAHVTASAVRDHAGAIAFIIGLAEDITARRQQEEALRESEAKLRRITESGVVGVFYWTLGRAISEANDEFLRMLGYTREDLMAGRLHGSRLTPPRWEAIDNAMIAQLRETGRATWEKEFYARDGRRVPVLVAKALLEGTTDRAIAICLDISERKQSEVERERLLAAEREARAQAERAKRMRDEMLALVAHDLRNPVNTIGMTAGLMREVPMTDETREHHINIIERAASGLADLISDLLDVSIIESGTFTIVRSTVDVATLLAEVMENFEAQATTAGITLIRDIAPATPSLAGDASRLTQVLSNLISNALKFVLPGGRIVLRATPRNGEVEICVEDTGPGMPSESVEHVFDRFWHASHASRAGSGLGLYICKGIIEAHGGRITVESTPGTGTAFRFSIPAEAGPQ